MWQNYFYRENYKEKDDNISETFNHTLYNLISKFTNLSGKITLPDLKRNQCLCIEVTVIKYHCYAYKVDLG